MLDICTSLSRLLFDLGSLLLRLTEDVDSRNKLTVDLDARRLLTVDVYSRSLLTIDADSKSLLTVDVDAWVAKNAVGSGVLTLKKYKK